MFKLNKYFIIDFTDCIHQIFRITWKEVTKNLIDAVNQSWDTKKLKTFQIKLEKYEVNYELLRNGNSLYIDNYSKKSYYQKKAFRKF